MFNMPAFLENNTGEMGRRFPDAFVRMGLWELLEQDARERAAAKETTEEFEQAFLYECLIAKLIEPIGVDDDGED